jgi:predicted nucleotidyltransferase
MRREEALKRLREHRTEVERLGVSRLALFGSVARDEAREDSDIDVLVEFSQPVGLFEFLRLDFYLEELLGSHVDLVTPDALKAKLRERILHEAIYAT